MSVENQVVIFLSFVIAGMLGGICFDFFRALRKNFDTIDLVVYIEDFIFWFLLYSFDCCNVGHRPAEI